MEEPNHQLSSSSKGIYQDFTETTTTKTNKTLEKFKY